MIKGTRLQDKDIDLTEIPESKCPIDSIDDRRTVEGRTVKITIQKGSPIRLRSLGIMVPNCQSRVYRHQYPLIKYPFEYNAI